LVFALGGGNGGGGAVVAFGWFWLPLAGFFSCAALYVCLLMALAFP
jgi:hypothetical protein